MFGLIIIAVILLIVWTPVALIGTAVAGSGLYEGGLFVKLASAVGLVVLYSPFIAVAYAFATEKNK